eukprot:CAMPEP_0114673356 /NCGR_PEP_ID=MMETSP0191-20121206/44596_1 /TAXON_ID=126664 /ORGANISM="Sorites sp." /LENGTH=260 /DNA_ID=CAMNT_0001938157 /DNA_START=644 /DNA_END=1423 /DNA_ORIENTATION=+
MAIDNRTPEQRKQDRQNYMKKVEAQRKRENAMKKRAKEQKLMDNQRALNNSKQQAMQRKRDKDNSANANLANLNANLSAMRSQRADDFWSGVNERKDAEDMKRDILQSQRSINQDRQRREEETRKLKNQMKTFQREFIELMTANSNGMNIHDIPNRYYIRHSKNWEPEKYYGFSNIEEIIAFNNTLKATLIVLNGYKTNTKWVIKETNYASLRIINNNIDDIIDACKKSNTIQQAIAILKRNKANKAKSNALSTKSVVNW